MQLIQHFKSVDIRRQIDKREIVPGYNSSWEK
jgi:hypothetical protein